jgi:DNA-binding HxlR family transcriptional regulator
MEMTATLSEYRRDECPLRDILDRFGDKWSVLTITMLSGGTMRFSELRRGLDGISQRMLTRTLRALERDGIVSRDVHPTVPPRVEYALTPLGSSLYSSILELHEWANRHHDAVRAARSAYDAAHGE